MDEDQSRRISRSMGINQEESPTIGSMEASNLSKMTGTATIYPYEDVRSRLKNYRDTNDENVKFRGR